MDLVCFSHLRWNFVYQRPQHLMSRFASTFRVFFIEEPIFGSDHHHLETNKVSDSLQIVVPHLPHGLSSEEAEHSILNLLTAFRFENDILEHIAWFYTPMAMTLSNAFPDPAVTVYDCMDELAAFKNAPPSLQVNEKLLLEQADVVFTGGHSLYEAKKEMHRNIHPFPSSIDKAHFSKARTIQEDPADQAAIPHPRVGFFGVIDERLDIRLIGQVAEARPDLHLVIIGPVVKIDPATLPQASNIHYLGGKSYDQLPNYLAGWDVAMISFAINESTKFISPTKTPEYLAGGKPVVSTPIADVVNPYGDNGLVYIAGETKEFIEGIDWALEIRKDPKWLVAVDKYLADISWDKTWEKMLFQINTILELKKRHSNKIKEDVHV